MSKITIEHPTLPLSKLVELVNDSLAARARVAGSGTAEHKAISQIVIRSEHVASAPPEVELVDGKVAGRPEGSGY